MECVWSQHATARATQESGVSTPYSAVATRQSLLFSTAVSTGRAKSQETRLKESAQPQGRSYRGVILVSWYHFGVIAQFFRPIMTPKLVSSWKSVSSCVMVSSGVIRCHPVSRSANWLDLAHFLHRAYSTRGK